MCVDVPWQASTMYEMLVREVYNVQCVWMCRGKHRLCTKCSFSQCPPTATISYLDSLLSNVTRVNPGTRSWKWHLSEWARCQKAIGGIYFTRRCRAETLQRGLEFDNFQQRLKSGIFKCISWVNGSFFGG